MSFVFAINPLSKKMPKLKDRIIPKSVSLTIDENNVSLKDLGDIRLKVIPKMLTGRKRMRHEYSYNVLNS